MKLRKRSGRKKIVKQEPLENEFVKTEASDCCVICAKGLKLQGIFAKHIQLQHSNGGKLTAIVFLHDFNCYFSRSVNCELKPPSTICFCIGCLTIKTDLISHIMSHFVSSEAYCYNRETRRSKICRLCPDGSNLQQIYYDHLQSSHADECKLF